MADSGDVFTCKAVRTVNQTVTLYPHTELIKVGVTYKDHRYGKSPIGLISHSKIYHIRPRKINKLFLRQPLLRK